MKNRPSEQAVKSWAKLVQVESRLLDLVQVELKLAKLPPLTWYDVLIALHQSLDGALRQHEIGEQVLLNKYNLSRLIDRLEGEALVERLPCLEDGRGNIVKITKEGGTLLKRMWPVYGAFIYEQFDQKLNPEEIAALGDILSKLLEN